MNFNTYVKEREGWRSIPASSLVSWKGEREREDDNKLTKTKNLVIGSRNG